MPENGNVEVERDARRYVTRGMAWLFGEMFLVPIRTFIFGMERLLETMKAFQLASDRGMELMAGGPPVVETKPEEIPATPPPILESSDSKRRAASGGPETEIEEAKMDKDLNDDMLKLVRYKILFVKRGYEHAFGEEESLVSDNMDGSAFTAWKIAEFIQRLAKVETVVKKVNDKEESHTVSASEIHVPWTGYPSAEYVREDRHGKKRLTGFPESDKKYLRLYYEVLERYNRQKLRYEEDHLDLLREQTRYIKEQKDCVCEMITELKHTQTHTHTEATGAH